MPLLFLRQGLSMSWSPEARTCLQEPVPPVHVAAAAAIIAAAGSGYCLAYNALQGELENPVVGLAWSLANLCPWLAAFELIKRRSLIERGAWRLGWEIVAIFAAATIVSMTLEFAFGLIAAPVERDLGFQVVRRLPGAGLVLLLLAARSLVSAGDSPRASSEGLPELPRLAQQIDWISAAGNYVELHGAAGSVLHRMTMAQAEARLARAGFVRIHRSVLVNEARIAEVRLRNLEAELDGGKVLKAGSAYRASLRLLAGRHPGKKSRHFVP